MALDYFHDVDFPLPIREGLRLTLRAQTQVHQTRSSVEQRRCDWLDLLWQVDVEPLIKQQDDFDRLVEFWRARKGASFRFDNFVDNTAQTVQFATGDGVTTTFQIMQAYASGYDFDSHTAYKPVHLPRLVTEVLVNGVLLPATDYTVSTTTGVITFDVAPGAGNALVWSGEFDTPMRFAATEMPTQLEEVGRFAATFQLLEDRGQASSDNFIAEATIPNSVLARLPLDMAEGSSFGPLHRILTLESDNQVTERLDINAGTRANASISYETQQLAKVQQFVRFFYARRGRYASFSMHDFTDYRTRGPVLQGIGDDTETVYGLRHAYTSGGETEYRRIYRPVAASVHVYLDDVATTDYVLDPLIGTVTFTTPPAALATITAEFEFDDLVRFDSDDLTVTIENNDILSVGPIDVVALSAEALTVAFQDGLQGRAVLPAYGCGVVAVVPAAPVPRAVRFNQDGVAIRSPLIYRPTNDLSHPNTFTISNRTPAETLHDYSALTFAFVMDRVGEGPLFSIGGPENLHAPQWGGEAIPVARVGLAKQSSGELVWGDVARAVPGFNGTYSVYTRAGSGTLFPNIGGDPCNESSRFIDYHDGLSSDNVAVVGGKEDLEGLGAYDGSNFINDVVVVIVTINLWLNTIFVSGSLAGTVTMTKHPGRPAWFEKHTVKEEGGCLVVESTPTTTWVSGAEPYLRKNFLLGGSDSVTTTLEASAPFDLYEFMLLRHTPQLAQAKAYISNIHQLLCGYFYRKYVLGVLDAVNIPDMYSWLDVADITTDIGDPVTGPNDDDVWTSHAGIDGARLVPGAPGNNFTPTLVAKAAKPVLPVDKVLKTFDGIIPYSVSIATEV